MSIAILTLASVGTFMVDFRINETRQTGAVGNRTYRVELNAVRSETVPTGEQKCLFIFRIHHSLEGWEKSEAGKVKKVRLYRKVLRNSVCR